MTDRDASVEDERPGPLEPIVAEGVDEEPVEANRRDFVGRNYLIIATLAAIYAAFHMAALNGVSIEDWTGIELPFLPTFPMETWNFRIVHVAGALFLGFLLFAAGTDFPEPKDDARATRLASYALMLPALFALGVAISFALDIRSGTMWNGMDAGIKFPRDVALRRAADGGDGRRHRRRLAAQTASCRLRRPGPRARRLRLRGRGLSHHDLRHTDAELDRDALRADRHLHRRGRRHAPDHGADPPSRRPRARHHLGGVPRLRLHRAATCRGS